MDDQTAFQLLVAVVKSNPQLTQQYGAKFESILQMGYQSQGPAALDGMAKEIIQVLNTGPSAGAQPWGNDNPQMDPTEPGSSY